MTSDGPSQVVGRSRRPVLWPVVWIGALVLAAVAVRDTVAERSRRHSARWPGITSGRLKTARAPRPRRRRPRCSATWMAIASADLTVFRPSTGNWFIRNSATAFATNTVRQWGLTGDVPVPGDYDGDGVGDLAVYRPARPACGTSCNPAPASPRRRPTHWAPASTSRCPAITTATGRRIPPSIGGSTGVWSVLTSSSTSR